MSENVLKNKLLLIMKQLKTLQSLGGKTSK